MSRSKWKGPFIEKNLLESINTFNKFKTITKVFSRNSYITPGFLGLTFNVHNGKTFLKLKINEHMIGYKLGEFFPTKKNFSFKKKLKKKNGTKS
jgi:small subunit ribosomal protein S19